MGIYQKGKNYYIDYYVNGRRKRKRIGPNKKLAEQVLKEMQVKAAKREYGSPPEEKRVTFAAYAEEYLAYSQTNKSPSSAKRDREILQNHLIPAFGSRYLFQIRALDVERYKAERRKAVAPATVNKELNCLKAMLNRAVEWDYLRANPLSRVKRLKEPPGRLRYLELDELTRLLAACATMPEIGAVVQIALHTGMRRSEILALTWRNIDLRRRLIILEKTKTNERRTIPINDSLLAVLHAIPRHVQTEVLFPELTGNSVTMAFRRACKRAEIPNFRFHDLRHTFASHLTMAGYNQRTIQYLLGHRDPRMTTRYSHLSEEYLSQAVKALDGLFQPPLAGEADEHVIRESHGHFLDTTGQKQKRVTLVTR